MRIPRDAVSFELLVAGDSLLFVCLFALSPSLLSLSLFPYDVNMDAKGIQTWEHRFCVAVFHLTFWASFAVYWPAHVAPTLYSALIASAVMACCSGGNRICNGNDDKTELQKKRGLYIRGEKRCLWQLFFLADPERWNRFDSARNGGTHNQRLCHNCLVAQVGANFFGKGCLFPLKNR